MTHYASPEVPSRNDVPKCHDLSLGYHKDNVFGPQIVAANKAAANEESNCTASLEILIIPSIIIKSLKGAEIFVIVI